MVATTRRGCSVQYRKLTQRGEGEGIYGEVPLDGSMALLISTLNAECCPLSDPSYDCVVKQFKKIQPYSDISRFLYISPYRNSTVEIIMPFRRVATFWGLFIFVYIARESHAQRAGDCTATSQNFSCCTQFTPRVCFVLPSACALSQTLTAQNGILASTWHVAPYRHHTNIRH